MQKLETVAVSETAIVDVANKIEDLESNFALNHPVRVMLADVRSKLMGVVKPNRQDKSEFQTKWVYVMESDVRL